MKLLAPRFPFRRRPASRNPTLRRIYSASWHDTGVEVDTPMSGTGRDHRVRPNGGAYSPCLTVARHFSGFIPLTSVVAKYYEVS